MDETGVPRRKKRRPGAPEGASPAPAAKGVVELGDRAFASVAREGYTLVDFWASWCGPCRTFSPVFHAVAAADRSSLRFATCNVDDNPFVSEQLQVRSIPTLVLLGPGAKELARQVGAVGRSGLEEIVASVVSRYALA